MRRRCAQFGCNAAATATFTFDTQTRTVWLDVPAEGGARAGELCSRHAASLRPPRGWLLEDRRKPVVTPTAPHLVADASGRGPDAELEQMLDAQSPLLARAFRSSGKV